MKREPVPCRPSATCANDGICIVSAVALRAPADAAPGGPRTDALKAAA